MLFVYISITVIALIFIVSLFYSAFVGGSPFAPARHDKVMKIVGVIAERMPRNAIVLDLGSGDGRILYAVARAGYRAVGIEINPVLVIYTRVMAFLTGLLAPHTKGKISVITMDYFKRPLPKTNVVTIFAVPYLMDKIEQLLARQLSPGSLVINYSTPLPHRKPVAVIDTNIYVYSF